MPNHSQSTYLLLRDCKKTVPHRQARKVSTEIQYPSQRPQLQTIASKNNTTERKNNWVEIPTSPQPSDIRTNPQGVGAKCNAQCRMLPRYAETLTAAIGNCPRKLLENSSRYS